VLSWTCAHATQQVLLEKGVEEGKIFFLTLIAAPEGLTNICRRYPKVRKYYIEVASGCCHLHAKCKFPAMEGGFAHLQVTLVTSEIDEGVGPGYQVVPGCGGFGDRYFCE
jgi:uracil phosphoribosyltransferase